MESKKGIRFGMLGTILYIKKEYSLIKSSIYRIWENIDSLDSELFYFVDDVA